MTPQEIAYLESRGWERDGGVIYWRHFRDGGLDVMHWQAALDRQTTADRAELIDAMLRLPALEAKLERIAELMNQIVGDPCFTTNDDGDDLGGYCLDDAALAALKAEVDRG